MKINGIEYNLSGEHGSSYLVVHGDYKKPATEVQIPSDIVNLGMTFHLLGGIKSIYLKGDMTVKLYDDSGLKEINTEESNKYTSKDGVLYNRQTGEKICIFDSMGTTSDGIHYTIQMNDNKTEVNNISFFTSYQDKRKGLTIRIPKFLAQYNMPIHILGDNIESLILEGNEIVDLSGAFGLKNIDIKNSTRYEERDGKVFDRILQTELKFPEYNKIKIIK